MNTLFKIIGLVITALMMFSVFINMSDEGKPTVPYEARQGIDPDWPKKRDEFYTKYCNDHAQDDFCKLRAKK